jgi:hypothetical protein
MHPEQVPSEGRYPIGADVPRLSDLDAGMSYAQALHGGRWHQPLGMPVGPAPMAAAEREKRLYKVVGHLNDRLFLLWKIVFFLTVWACVASGLLVYLVLARR